MRLPPRHEMRPESHAFHAEQLRFPNQTQKDPRFVLILNKVKRKVIDEVTVWKCLESIYLIKNLCSEYAKNPHNSRTQSIFFLMGKDLDRSTKRYTDEDNI